MTDDYGDHLAKNFLLRISTAPTYSQKIVLSFGIILTYSFREVPIAGKL